MQGVLLGEFANAEAPEAKRFIERAAREGRRSLLLMNVNPGRGVGVVDGDGGSPLDSAVAGPGPQLPFLYLTNDARRIDGATTNTRFGPNGAMFATRNISPVNLAAAATLQALAGSELLVRYDAQRQTAAYWRFHETLGDTRENPITFEACPSHIPLLAPSMSTLSVRQEEGEGEYSSRGRLHDFSDGGDTGSSACPPLSLPS